MPRQSFYQDDTCILECDDLVEITLVSLFLVFEGKDHLSICTISN